MGEGTTYSSSYPMPMGGGRKMRGCVKEIFIAFAVMTIPMVLFSALLLGLIFHFRVTQNDFISSNLAFAFDQTNSNVIFVKMSATTLITIASWSSTAAPILVGFVITLVSYPVAKGLLLASERHDISQLPTPFQLSLILRIISSASPFALWSWLKYSFGWRNWREPQVKAIKSLTSILAVGLVLSFLVLVTDTWLHFTTKTVIFYQIMPTSNSSGLGFGVNPNCTNTDTTTLMGCNLDHPASGAVLLSSDPMKALSNISDSIVVQVHSVGTSQFAYLASAQYSRLAALDYTVNTTAVQSQCTPVTSKCASNGDVGGAQTKFKCPFAFTGAANTSVGASNSVSMAYFTDSTGKDNNTDKGPISNPYYYASMSVVNMRNGRPLTLAQDPEVLQGGHGGSTLIALFCNSTVYDLEYTSVNGTITNFSTSNANSSTTRIIQSTERLTDVGIPNLVQAASVAGLGDSAQEFADQFALAYSQTALAVASGAFEPREAQESQTREQLLVARVPKAPLMSLVAANLLLAILGLILTVVALATVYGDTREVQARLSIPVVVASLFEGTRVTLPVEEVEDMFHERHGQEGVRVGFGTTVEGGWSYKSWYAN